MKKVKFLVMALSVALCAGFTACGGDDDDDNGGSISGGNVDTSRVPANAVYTTAAGNRMVVKSINSTTFTYNADGFCTKVGSNLNIFYSGGLIVYGEDTQAKFSMNGQGFITGIDVTVNDKNDSYTEKGEAKIRYAYNGNGYLTKMTMESNNTYLNVDEGTDSYEKSSGEMIFTWEGGKLIKASAVAEGEEDGERYRYTSDYVIQSNGVANTLGQYTMAYSEFFDDSFYTLSLVGMYGKAPAEFIQSIAETYEEIEEDDIDKGSSVTTYDYEFNTNNMISTETEDGQYRYSYSYDVLSTSLLAPRQGSKELKPRVRKHAFGPMSLRERRVARK